MRYGICKLSMIPGREDHSDKSEMVTQLLFGEHYKVIDERKMWVKVRLAYDQYECWVDRKQFFEISEEEFESLDSNKHPVVSGELFGLVKGDEEKTLLPILPGSTLPHYTDAKIRLGDLCYTYEGTAISPNGRVRGKIVQDAYLFLNAPYLWGGRSLFGIDCSGLVQVVYKLNGIKMPRDAFQQAEKGQTLSFLEEAKEGDLAFFDNEEGMITHVGILLNNNHIIHASGKVRIDRIDHQGIFNDDLRDYSHKLRLLTRVVPK